MHLLNSVLYIQIPRCLRGPRGTSDVTVRSLISTLCVAAAGSLFCQVSPSRPAHAQCSQHVSRPLLVVPSECRLPRPPGCSLPVISLEEAEEGEGGDRAGRG